MLYSSAWLAADECKSIGLVLDVYPDESLLDEVMQRAQAITATSPEGVLRFDGGWAAHYSRWNKRETPMHLRILAILVLLVG